MLNNLTRPIIGIENRTAREVFDIMSDRIRSALSPAATPVSEAEPDSIKAAQITMGLGLVDVTRIEHEGRAGILFRPRDQHIPIGDEGKLQPGKYWPASGDVVIWIENEGGAEVIREYLAPFLAKPASSPADWLIRKGGYFYRPNKAGYTTRKSEAGRYTEADAKAEAQIEPGMKAIRAEEWPDDPASSPAGGDVRDALERAAQRIEQEKSKYLPGGAFDVKRLLDYIAKEVRALSQSTSAGRGE